MASKRIIQSNIWEDEFMGNLSLFERLLWIGLFSRCADDQGRMNDNPIVIRSQVFPYDDIPVSDIDAGLKRFAAEGRIIRYKVGRKGFIQLVKWWENQTPQWAMPSNYPSPEGWEDRVRSYIKGVYHCQNWPTKIPPKQEDIPDNPGGMSSLPSQVARHDPVLNPVINKDPPPLPAVEPAPATPSLPLTAGQKSFLAAFGAKRFKTAIQKDAVAELERKYGTVMLEEGITWAAKQGMNIGHAITSLETALAKWGKDSRASPVPVVDIPTPTLICGDGDRLKKRAAQASGQRNYQALLQDYLAHLRSCRICSGGSNSNEIQDQISKLAGKMKAPTPGGSAPPPKLPPTQ
jgi:hypothetical protein